MSGLHFIESGHGKPLLILHGLFGSGRNWQSQAGQLASHFQVFNIDLRNHGRSFHADEMNYPAMAADVEKLLLDQDIDHCYILGHSMGGKVAMTLAALNPARVSGMVIADIAPVTYYHHHDLIDPILALPLDTIDSRAEADLVLRDSIPEEPLRAFLLQNLMRESGAWRWRVNWEVIQRDMGQLTGFNDLPDRWMIDLPTLFIRGANSDYIGEVETEVIKQHFSNPTFETVDDAGHWLHAEKPEEFMRRVFNFLQTL